jgi:hypothetical protein
LATKFHDTLARYFESRPLYLDEPEQQPHVRKVVEQPYQETLSGRWDALTAACLADYPFLMAKAKAALVEGILEDYALAFEEMPQEWREQFKFWEAFFRERAHILRRGTDDWPAYKILLQLAMEHADDSPVTRGAEALPGRRQMRLALAAPGAAPQSCWHRPLPGRLGGPYWLDKRSAGVVRQANTLLVE